MFGEGRREGGGGVTARERRVEERKRRVKRVREEFPVLVDRLERGLSKQALQV